VVLLHDAVGAGISADIIDRVLRHLDQNDELVASSLEIRTETGDSL